MNIDSYWADEDDWDDEFCYREINPFDDSAACTALGAFTTDARTAHVIPKKKELPVMMGNNGGDDNDTIPFGMHVMSAEEYLNGMADDSWLCDPCDWEVAVGDEIVVRSPNGTKVVKVIEVHDMADIDLEATFTYKWAVSVVPNKEYDERLKEEEKHATTLKQLQRQAALKKQLAAIVGELGDEAQDFINSITKK